MINRKVLSNKFISMKTNVVLTLEIINKGVPNPSAGDGRKRVTFVTTKYITECD